MIKYLTLFLFLCLPISLYADVYEGTIGKSLTVVVELNETDLGNYEGRYFYKKHQEDILLEGSLDRLSERPASEHFSYEPKSFWSGKFIDNTFIGNWESIENSKSLPVKLTKIGASTRTNYGDLSNTKRSKYDQLKMKRKLKYSTPIKTKKGIAYQWVSDAKTSATYPIIVEHPSKQKMDRLNKELMKRFWSQVLDYDGCDSLPQVEVNYLSSSILDLTESGSVYCGGAHPANFISPKTFDFSTGEKIKWADYIYGIATGEYGEEISDKELLAKVREKILNSNDMPECIDLVTEESFLHSFAFRIKKEGFITLGLRSVPHAMTPCLGDYADIPISEFKLWPRKQGENLFN